MAITCDYCQKPLSLMRRLRGEQFCSVEHMDLYIAQQAEFALERLAAAADEKPNTARPPSLLRRLANPVVTEVEDPDNTLNPFSSNRPEPFLGAPVPVTGGPEYPMAPFVEQMPSVREPGPDSTEEELVPSESWGAAASAWSMPAFEFEPASEPKEDPRTWNAGKLVSQVPPLAHLRTLLAVKAPEPSDSTPTVAIARIQPAPELFSPEPALPGLSAEVEHIKETWSDEQLRQIFATPAGHRMPRAADTRTPIAVLPELVDAAPELVTLSPTPSQDWTSQDLTHQWAHPGPRIPGLSARVAEFTIDAMGGPRFAAAAPVLELTATLVSCLPLLSQWRPCAVAPKPSHAAGLDPALPVSATLPQVWPPAPAWNLPQSFEAGKVQMPAWALRPTLTAVIRTSDGQWLPFPMAAHPPVAPAAAPHFGYAGPAFGWERAPLHTVETSALASEGAVEGEGATQFRDLDAPFTVPAGLGPLAAPVTPRHAQKNAIAEPHRAGTADPLAPPAIPPRLQDIRARVSAQFTRPGRHSDGTWSEARVDASTIEPSLNVTLRPSFTAVETECPLFRLDAPRFTYAAGRVPEAFAVPGPIPAAVPAEAPDWTGRHSHWFAPSVARPALRHVAVVLLRPLSGQMSGRIDHAPVLTSYTRYSPVALVVMPPHQFKVLAPAVFTEERFVAQPQVNSAPPRVRQTGYRAFGPFPKLPARMPRPTFEIAASAFHAPLLQAPYRQRMALDDRTGLPKFPPVSEMRLHPAHYWAWPTPKAPRAARVLPEWFQEVPPASPDTPEAPPRRFGPGRETGLQGLRRSADGLPKAGA